MNGLGGLVDWWIGLLVDWWIGGLVDWFTGGLVLSEKLVVSVKLGAPPSIPAL